MKPRLLDLFAGAGGAARGYQLAGFHVTGIDIARQPRYAGDEFIQDDAMRVLAEDELRFGVFDAIHASPPCQHYANVTRWKGNQDEHPDLIGPTRELLEATGLPWVMENVRTKALRPCVVLCGSMFGLPIRRHRGFETNWMPYALVQPCQHRDTDYAFDHGAKQPESVYRDAMGCEWMTVEESREAIPPAYTNLIGAQLLNRLQHQASLTPPKSLLTPTEKAERA